MKTAAIVPTRDKIAMLKHLANGRDLDFVAEAISYSVDEIRDAVASHGYPDRTNMARAAQLLQAKLDDEARNAIAVPAHNFQPVPRPTQIKGSAPRPAPAAAMAPAERVEVDTLADLVAAARKSKKAQTRKAGDRLEELAQTIRTRIADEAKAERTAAAEKKRKAKQRAEERAEVERLENELAAARARLNGYDPAESGEIREWAAVNGYQVAERGAIAKLVVAAWKAAQS